MNIIFWVKSNQFRVLKVTVSRPIKTYKKFIKNFDNFFNPKRKEKKSDLVADSKIQSPNFRKYILYITT